VAALDNHCISLCRAEAERSSVQSAIDFPDGTDFVGRGVQPDKLVRPTVADFRSGRDTVLEAALRELKK